MWISDEWAGRATGSVVVVVVVGGGETIEFSRNAHEIVLSLKQSMEE